MSTHVSRVGFSDQMQQIEIQQGNQRISIPAHEAPALAERIAGMAGAIFDWRRPHHTQEEM